MEGLCVVCLLVHVARSGARSVTATGASERLNERASEGESEANELIQSHGIEWNEANRRGRTLLLLVYRSGPSPASASSYTDNEKVAIAAGSASTRPRAPSHCRPTSYKYLWRQVIFNRYTSKIILYAHLTRIMRQCFFIGTQSGLPLS